MAKRKPNPEQSKKRTVDLFSLLSEFGSVSLEGVYIEKITVTRKDRK